MPETMYEGLMLIYAIILITIGTISIITQKLIIRNVVKNPHKYSSNSITMDIKDIIKKKHMDKLTHTHAHLFEDDKLTNRRLLKRY
ncbi:hypothetical protein [Ornithinibacillus halophilus]|uniref:Uncharacterized protein n=1 Tax=Ornithinibacillus halophilus TaxID=930117 RepID=A0A1M5G2L4_9BACI|nr:hypothetical protein [Ornithinibacillus halophilus]SHF97973.1 hypothetical protein SAMN05216225_101139 [Ornithinibacillus halophilus]